LRTALRPAGEHAMSELQDGAVETLACAWPPCRQPFIARKRWQKYCSNRCRMAHANYDRLLGAELFEEFKKTHPVPLPPGSVGTWTST
jgi:hypothetical protein